MKVFETKTVQKNHAHILYPVHNLLNLTVLRQLNTNVYYKYILKLACLSGNHDLLNTFIIEKGKTITRKCIEFILY